MTPASHPRPVDRRPRTTPQPGAEPARVGTRPTAEQTVASVSRARWGPLLRFYRARLPHQDLEDCLSQATLELVVQARRGTLDPNPEFIAFALEHKFASRISDRHRAAAGRSLAATTEARAVSLHALGERLPARQDTARQVIARDELHRIARLLDQLTPDQRLAVLHPVDQDTSPAVFAREHGWTLDKYRKVSQRGRGRLARLLADSGQRPAAP